MRNYIFRYFAMKIVVDGLLSLAARRYNTNNQICFQGNNSDENRSGFLLSQHFRTLKIALRFGTAAKKVPNLYAMHSVALITHYELRITH